MLPQKKGPIIVMATVVGISIGAVYYSHYAQVRDQNYMKAGVERDKERLRAIRMKQKLDSTTKQQ
jgi:PET assembly of cytochrome c oxidase, mitochondrial